MRGNKYGKLCGLIIAALYMLSCSSSYYKEKRGDMTAHWLRYDYPSSPSRSYQSDAFYNTLLRMYARDAYYTPSTYRRNTTYKSAGVVDYGFKPVEVKRNVTRARVPRSYFIPAARQSDVFKQSYRSTKVYQTPKAYIPAKKRQSLKPLPQKKKLSVGF